MSLCSHFKVAHFLLEISKTSFLAPAEWSLWWFAEGCSDFNERERTIAEACTASEESHGFRGVYRSRAVGSVQLINAAINSLSLTNASNLAIVTVVAPFCSG
ncbi:hypothetical protein SUGI_0379140 [Cryptomeria japonica]|nr:hypothetical protein SUGI_0379140 [Cryptomeria japonica]